MGVIFENKTRYSQKDYDIFLESYKKEYSTSEYAYTLFYILFFGLCMVLAFMKKDYLLGIGIIVGLGIYLWYKIIRPNQLVNKTRNSQELSGNFVNNYEFYKNYFKVENSEGKAQALYLKLYRVVETKEYFYIYISRQYAYIISKSGFTKGDKDEFSKFIRKKVFITRYRRRTNE